MIVTDDLVSKALHYLSEDPHPIALAQKELTDAENEKDRIFAEAYAEAGQVIPEPAVGRIDARTSSGDYLTFAGTGTKLYRGSIRDREMACERRGEIVDARKRIAEGLREFARHKARVKAAEMIIEVWRSENANARAAERVR